MYFIKFANGVKINELLNRENGTTKQCCCFKFVVPCDHMFNLLYTSVLLPSITKFRTCSRIYNVHNLRNMAGVCTPVLRHGEPRSAAYNEHVSNNQFVS